MYTLVRLALIGLIITSNTAQAREVTAPTAPAICAAYNGKTIQVRQSVTLPAHCQLTDTRFVFENVQNVSLNLNGAILQSSKLHDAIRFTTTDPQRPTRNVAVSNGTIRGYGTALYVHRHLSPADLQAVRANPAAHYAYLQRTATQHVRISNITFDKPRGTAIYVWVANSHVTIRNNRIIGAHGPAIYLDTASHSNLVQRNVIRNSGFLAPNGTPKRGRSQREGIAIDGSYNNRIVGNTLIGNAGGGIHLYSNCGEKVSTDPTYVPRTFDAERNLIKNNNLRNNGNGGAVEIGKRVDWNLEKWDCAKPVYASYLGFKYYWDNSGYNRVETNKGNGLIYVRTDNNSLISNQQPVDVNSVVRTLKGNPLVNNQVR